MICTTLIIQLVEAPFLSCVYSITIQSPPSTIDVNRLLAVYFGSRGDLALIVMGNVVRVAVVGLGVSLRMRDGRTGLVIGLVRGDGGETIMSAEGFGPSKNVSEVISLSVQLY